MSPRNRGNRPKQQTPLARGGNAPQSASQHVQISASARMSFEGPLPPPQLLAQYEAAIPGLGERIIALMEKQTEHRISIENTVIGSDISRSKWGLVAGFVVAMSGLGISYYLIATGNGLAGAILSGVDIVSLAGIFIYGTASRKAERIDKEKRLLGQD